MSAAPHLRSLCPARQVSALVDARLVANGLIKPRRVIGLGAAWRPMTFDEAYPSGWRFGDAMAVVG